MKRYLKPALVLLVICLCAATVLAVVNGLTAQKIAENAAAAENEAIGGIFGEGITVSDVGASVEGVKKIYVVTRGSEALGWCVSVSPNGFGGNIDMVVGISADREIIGIIITALSETPGLGSRVADPLYLAGYEGLSGNLRLGEEIDAISGATISSRSVLAGVNRALGAVASRSARADAISAGGAG